MENAQNSTEIKWLEEAPGQLLTHYQYIVEATVAKFIVRGFFSANEKMEVVQEINLRLLEQKMQKIQEHFKGTVLLRTYFAKVVYNTCLEICRQQRRQPQVLGEEHLMQQADSKGSAHELLVIKDELLRLQAALKGLQSDQYKGRLCLKAWVRFVLTQLDIQFYQSPKTTKAIEAIKAKLFSPYHDLTDQEVYGLLIELFNLVENKNNTADSLRKWVVNIIDQLIVLLNGEPPVSSHSRQSMKLLLQYYFDQKED